VENILFTAIVLSGKLLNRDLTLPIKTIKRDENISLLLRQASDCIANLVHIKNARAEDFVVHNVFLRINLAG